jgi:tetratricopeptide (TPR) repeat protein
LRRWVVKRLALILGLLVLTAVFLPAQVTGLLQKADALHEEGSHEQARSVLDDALGRAGSGPEKAEVLWRLARAWLNIGEDAEDRGAGADELLGYFEKGESFAVQATEADPNNPLGYYWQSANVGKWGQVKGIMNALAKAKPMRDLLQKALSLNPEHADSYYVLGQLYEQVPGFPLSFGDKEYAVSLGRKSVDLREAQVRSGVEKELVYDYYTQLASHLWERNWSASKRSREQRKMAADYAGASDPMEKNFHYEGTLTLKNASDREEALELLRRTVRQLESLQRRTDGQNDDLAKARELLEEWD